MIFDFETNGLPDFNKRARDPEQPHIVQVAAMICDEEGNELDFFEAIAKPDGWVISKELSDIHGITHEHALAVGIPEIEICEKLLVWIKKTQRLIAHNLTFDKFIARCGMRRFDLIQDSDDLWWKNLPTFCTMKPMTNICKLPPKNGGRGYKYPKLIEAYEHAFKKKFDGQHNAVNDLRACKELFFWMVENGITA